ncbi:hypothetical protein LPJ73_007327 [Coemansia sp. RSA 2703]|nr:hypothetical protein LPJ73_007327 [Coemansia sp. RSA 2703]
MQQQTVGQQGRAPAGLTLGSRSVVDRVKWIEKTHGSAGVPLAAAGTGRARLRLPKNFGEPQSPMASKDSAVSVDKDGEGDGKQEEEKLQETRESVRQPIPSPALSEVSTLATSSVIKSTDTTITQTTVIAQSEDAEHPGHSRMHSTDSSISSLSDRLLYMGGGSSNVSSGSLEDFASDPVHVGSTQPPSKSQASLQSPSLPQSPGGSSVNKYERCGKPTSGGEGARARSLGGIRGRDAAPARRFNRAQAEEAAREQHGETSEGEHESSLLSRLGRLSCGRPRIQDLVSNRAAPKFVKRSHHYDAKPLAEHANGSLSGSKFRGSHTQKRYV